MKLVKKILGENEIDSVLQRLDRLTLDEARTTATQTLEIVHGLVQNMRVVVDGKAPVSIFTTVRHFNSLPSRRQGIGRCYLGYSKYVRLTGVSYQGA